MENFIYSGCVLLKNPAQKSPRAIRRQTFWAFWKLEIRGFLMVYDMVYNMYKISKMTQYPPSGVNLFELCSIIDLTYVLQYLIFLH